MGRGDKKTKKGKRFAGSFGKHRPRKVNSAFKKEEKKA
jgi:ribosomal small subunit protein bTHX